MNTTSLQSTINKAREQFENGHAKACVETLKGVLGDLKVGEPEWYQLRNDTSFLLARLSGLERERGMISEQNYMVEWNKLFHSTNQLVLDFETGVKEMGEREKAEEPGLYPAELVLGLDYEKTEMEEVKGRILRIENILNMGLDLPERITGTRAGSVVVELSLYAEEIVKIKSLVKLGLVDDVVGFKLLDDGWDWIEGEKFRLVLNETDLHGANLRFANLCFANLRFANFQNANLYNADLHNADLRGVDFSAANLMVANLRGTDLRSADHIGTDIMAAHIRDAKNIIFFMMADDLNRNNFSRTNLVGTNLSGANLSAADLRGTDFSTANLMGAHLWSTNLAFTIFHKNQRELLESMGIDISNVIFVDDDGKKVENWVEVE